MEQKAVFGKKCSAMQTGQTGKRFRFGEFSRRKEAKKDGNYEKGMWEAAAWDGVMPDTFSGICQYAGRGCPEAE